MIDFSKFEIKKLKDVATFERVKKDKFYKKGTSLIQISATKGEIYFLESNKCSETKNVAIMCDTDILDPRYFNICLHANIGYFLNKYKEGINVKEKDIGNILIQVRNFETQKCLVDMFSNVDTQIEITERKINTISELKKLFLSDMFV